MPPHSSSPSEAWLQAVFNSPQRRDIDKLGGSTTRTPVVTGQPGQPTYYCEGNFQLTAARLLEYLWRAGQIRRWKVEPFDLAEVGGPVRHVPDLLVQLNDLSAHVIQVKGHRHLTQEVLETFEDEKRCLTSIGFGFHVWTNRDRLAPQVSHPVNMIDRGYRDPTDQSELAAIAKDVSLGQRTLGPLLITHGREAVFCAIAYLYIFLDVTRGFDEQTPVFETLPADYYKFLFETRNDSVSWWDSLSHQWP